MGDFAYPTPISRQRYITVVGGHSSLLGENQIGLNVKAIISRTNFSGGEEVIINSLETDSKNSSQSLFSREVFEITPITDFHDSRILSMSSDGEAVLSKECSIETETGEEIELNAGIDKLPENWPIKLVKNYVEDGEKSIN